MTRDEAQKLIGLIPSTAYTEETGWGRTSKQSFADSLKAAFPEFNWRIILNRSCERSYWTLTIDDDDPREFYDERRDDELRAEEEEARFDMQLEQNQ